LLGRLAGVQREKLVTRYRLRFHLQEVDLQQGVTYIGRSDECAVTIEDPLVSRRHALIHVEGDEVKIEDLGSRNGVRVNGKPVQASQSLGDGDRVRIGSQDFVFCRIQQRKVDRTVRTTGVLRLCAQCKAPHAREMISCPNCGHEEGADEDTLSGSFGPGSQYSWSVQLMIEALEKAVSLGRFVDADRILRRTTALLEERLASDEEVSAVQLGPLAAAAERICNATGDVTWGMWLARFCVRAEIFPPAALSDRFIGLRLRHPELAESIESLLAYCRGLNGARPREDRDAILRLARAHQGVLEETLQVASA
jgi:hypothetical protein